MSSQAAESKSAEPKPDTGSDQLSGAPELAHYVNQSPQALKLLIREEKKRLECFEQSDVEALKALVPDLKKKIDSLRDALILSYDRYVSEQISAPVSEAKPVIVSNMQNSWARQITHNVSMLNKFQGSSPEELTSFLTEIQQIFEVLVKGKDSESERHFLDEVKLRLDATILTRLQDSGGAENFTDLVKWLRKNYGEQHTSYQLLSKAWSAEYKSGTQFVTYSAAIERSMRTARDHIKSSWATNHNGQAMTVDDAFELFSGMLMVETVRKEHFEVYQAMTNKLDTLTTAAKVAAEAETIRTHYGAKSLSSGEKTFYAPKNDKKKSATLPQGKSLNERLDKHEKEFSEIRKILMEIQSNTRSNKAKSSGPSKKSGKSKEPKKSKEESESEDEGSQKQTSNLAKDDTQSASGNTYLADSGITCPDLSEKVLESFAGFH